MNTKRRRFTERDGGYYLRGSNNFKVFKATKKTMRVCVWSQAVGQSCRQLQTMLKYAQFQIYI